MRHKLKKLRRTVSNLDLLLNEPIRVSPAAENALVRANLDGSIQYPRELFDFIHDSIKPLVYSVEIKKQTEPNATLERVLKLLRHPDATLPQSIALEIAHYADSMRHKYDLSPYGCDVGFHFSISSSLRTKARLLFNIARGARPLSCLELGTGYGISALVLLRVQELCGIPPSLTTVEGNSPQQELSAGFLSSRFPAARLIHGMKRDVIEKLRIEGATFDFVFHDGGHSGDEYVSDFFELLPLLRPGAFVLVDDIRWTDLKSTPSNLTCYDGWKKIASSPMVTNACEIQEGNLGLLILK